MSMEHPFGQENNEGDFEGKLEEQAIQLEANMAQLEEEIKAQKLEEVFSALASGDQKYDAEVSASVSRSMKNIAVGGLTVAAGVATVTLARGGSVFETVPFAMEAVAGLLGGMAALNVGLKANLDRILENKKVKEFSEGIVE